MCLSLETLTVPRNFLFSTLNLLSNLCLPLAAIASLYLSFCKLQLLGPFLRTIREGTGKRMDGLNDGMGIFSEDNALGANDSSLM